MSAPVNHLGIVVGVDGSPASIAAVEWAAHDAAIRDVSLTLVHVASGLGGTWAQTPPPAGLGLWQHRRGHRFLDEAAKVADSVTRDGEKVPVSCKIYYSATVPTLLDMSKEADLVVVGRHSQRLGATLGSVSSGLIRHGHCPVAVVGPGAVADARPATAPVLVGIDGSPASELATAMAFDEASRRCVELIALHAWDDAGLLGFPGVDWPMLETSEEEVLAERLAGWQERYPDVAVRREVARGRPARHLIDRSDSAQLVVIGSHGRGGFAGMALGSVSAAVVQAARIPVIVARPR